MITYYCIAQHIEQATRTILLYRN